MFIFTDLYTNIGEVWSRKSHTYAKHMLIACTRGPLLDFGAGSLGFVYSYWRGVVHEGPNICKTHAFCDPTKNWTDRGVRYSRSGVSYGVTWRKKN